jgi:small subunit ribosomal protein S6
MRHLLNGRMRPFTGRCMHRPARRHPCVGARTRYSSAPDMTLPAPTYDLVLLLDTQVEADVRAKIVADASAAIGAQGELLRHDVWGDRALTYPIDHKTSAEYHLLQFHASTPELLRGLDRSLRIADGVVRFRIVKLKPGTPAAPDMSAAASASRPAELDAEVETVGEPA